MPSTETVRVTIFNQSYSLVSDDGGDIHELARIVDELMTAVSRSGNLDSTRTAVLACLHLADRFRTAERELAAYKSVVADKAEHFTVLLDSVVQE